MKWNVGFKYATGYSGTVTANPSLSNDKKTISVSCDLGTSTKSETCSVDETFENDSTFDIKLSEEPIITFDDNYIESVNIVNADKEVRTLVKDQTISVNSQQEFRISIVTKELEESMLNEDGLFIPVNITMNWIEVSDSER